jgi:PAS domain S-box-containing protein
MNQQALNNELPSAASAAEEARLLLAAAVEFSDDAIVGKNLDGIISFWNRGAERIFGYTAQEAVGQPMTLIIPPEYHHEEEQILAQLKRGERIERFETIRRRKDGTLLDVSLVISPIKASSGRIIGASKIARDITEPKRVREALRLSEARFRTLAEELPQLIWTSRPDGPCDYLSPQWVDYTGVGAEEQLGFAWLQQVHPEDREALEVEWKPCRCATPKAASRNGSASTRTSTMRDVPRNYLKQWFKTVRRSCGRASTPWRSCSTPLLTTSARPIGTCRASRNCSSWGTRTNSMTPGVTT